MSIPPLPAGTLDDKKLELILTYTVFHIGVYISLATAFIGASFLADVFKKYRLWLILAVISFVAAGALGGLIASNIAEDPVTYDGLLTGTPPLEAWGHPLLQFRCAARFEHTAFWVGVLVTLGVFLHRSLQGSTICSQTLRRVFAFIEAAESRVDNDGAKKLRDQIINSAVVTAIIASALSLALAVPIGTVWCKTPYHQVVGYGLLAAWIGMPPLYFFLEYALLPPPATREARVQHMHDLCRNIWVAFVVLLAAIMGIHFPGTG